MNEAEKQSIMREFLQNDKLADDILSLEVLLSTLLTQMMQRIMKLEEPEHD